MRRLAIVFAVLATVNTIEHAAAWSRACHAPRRPGRSLKSLAEWKKFLIGRLQLTASSLGSRLIGEIN